MDRNVPSATPISRCAAISAYLRPSSRLRSGTRGTVRFSTRTRSRSTP